MGDLWNLLIIKPFAWILLSLYKIVGSYGMAIILFAIVAKVVLLYFSIRGKKAMMQQQRLMPKQKELELKYKNDKAKYQQELQNMYQREGVSMMGGCLWSLLPFPVLIALFTVVREPLYNLMSLTKDQVTILAEKFGVSPSGAYIQLDLAQRVYENFDKVQAWIPDASGLIKINFDFLGLNLSSIPQISHFSALWLIPILSGATAYLSMFLSQKFSGQQSAAQGSMKTMMLLSPLMSVWFAFIMPAAMGVYWITNNILAIIQEYFLTKHFKKVFAADDERKASLEARRKEAEEKMKEENRMRRLAEGSENKNKSKKKVYRMQKSPNQKGQADNNSDGKGDENGKEH